MFDIQNIKRNVSRLTKHQLSDQKSKDNQVITSFAEETVVATLGASVEINGDLRGHEDIRIEGLVEGSVNFSNHTVIIGAQGHIQADIYANVVIVEGEVHGNVYGSEKVVVKPCGNVLGDIKSPRVSLEDGAIFKGRIEMEAIPYIERNVDRGDRNHSSESIQTLSSVDG